MMQIKRRIESYFECMKQNIFHIKLFEINKYVDIGSGAVNITLIHLAVLCSHLCTL